MAKKDRKNQYPAYAVTGDDGKERPEYQYPAYAVKSDDGKNQQYPISKKPMLPTTAMMAKNQTETRINLFYYKEVANQDQDGDDGVELAFTKQTTMDCMHIISYTLDEHYNQDGELVES